MRRLKERYLQANARTEESRQADAHRSFGGETDVQIMLEKLTSQQQALVIGRHLLEMSMQDLSSELRLSLPSVYRQYGRAMERLREVAKARGLIE